MRKMSASTLPRKTGPSLLGLTVLGLTVLTLLSALSAAPAQAQKKLDLPTQNERDPRRSANTAKVAAEPNPEKDPAGHDDPSRTDDSFQPKGIELGSFLLLPQLENELTYNSNVFAQETGGKSDLILRVAPEFKLRSRFSSHALNITARAEQYLFKTYTSDNHLDAGVLVDGRYDLERGAEITNVLDLNQRYEDRGSPDAVGGKHPTLTYAMQNTLGGKKQMGRYTVSGELQNARRLFNDSDTAAGTSINNSDRDRWEHSAMLRGSYEMFPGYSAVAEIRGNTRRYDDRVDDAGLNRSSKGYQVNAGIGVDISQLIRGDFLLGYYQQDYEDNRLRDPRGLSFRAAFNWTPTRMTVVVPSLERTVLETTQGSTSAMVRSNLSLLVRHELQRNIILTGSGSVSYDEFKGINKSSWTYETRGRVLYAFSPEVYVGGEVGFRSRESELAGQSYQQLITSVRFGLRM